MSNRIITVGRQFGSNGRAVAKRLADDLGIAFYDRKLIEMAAERSQIHPDKLDEADEKTVNRWWYSTAGMQSGVLHTPPQPINDILFKVQCEILRELGEKDEDCVIVGRCADYVLRGHPKLWSIFLYAPFEARRRTVMDRFSIPDKDAVTLIKRMDKDRRFYYNFYTDRRWGDLSNYQMALDTSVLGVDRSADILAAMFREIRK